MLSSHYEVSDLVCPFSLCRYSQIPPNVLCMISQYVDVSCLVSTSNTDPRDWMNYEPWNNDEARGRTVVANPIWRTQERACHAASLGLSHQAEIIRYMDLVTIEKVKANDYQKFFKKVRDELRFDMQTKVRPGSRYLGERVEAFINFRAE